MLRDLNLLFVFEAMWKYRSVSGAAESLGVTQAGVSNSLKRLRMQYNDKLFTLVGRVMDPTPFAVSISSQLLDALDAIRQTGTESDVFEPLTEKRTFTVRTRDVGEVVCFPAILDGLREEAPLVRLRSTFLPHEETLAGLAKGRIDLAIGHLPALQTDLHRVQLFEQRHVLVMRHAHPAASRDLTSQALERLEFVLVEYEGSEHLIFERALIDSGARPRIKLRLPQFMSAAHIVSRSDLVWLAPETIATAVAETYPLVLRESPYVIENAPICMYWHDRYHKDPANKWFRELIRRHCSAPPGSRNP
ncbi:transcriptional regulator, LysR family [Burkholderia sp. lig30]|uniref:LysR family transcriptional regulator n=1 Tax=Burkholderia sp. lig30 TaxID=1192124 RepID=UPI000460E98A|nr:LysR family transcriptional regulator [Burkholderia sp. lig30]KDB08149.1 transcriptional regulator, LysR family [Burkholderia sp. lig30]